MYAAVYAAVIVMLVALRKRSVLYQKLFFYVK